MALIAVLTRDPALRRTLVRGCRPERDEVITTPCPASTQRIVLERPVSIVVLDARSLPSRPDRAVGVVEGVRSLFASVPLGVVASLHDVHLLRALGAVGLRHLLLEEEAVHSMHIVRRFLLGLRAEGVEGRVSRALSPRIGRWEMTVVGRALDRGHRRMDADSFAAEVGFTRPHLSRRLQEAGLPSTGHLLRWTTLFLAGQWMPDRGRSGESVSRQLEYANGSTFRRALRRDLGMTPSELARAGLPEVLRVFVEDGGFASACLARVA